MTALSLSIALPHTATTKMPLPRLSQLKLTAPILAWAYRLLRTSSSTYHRTLDDIQEEFEVIQAAQADPRMFAPIYERYFDQIFIFINRRVDHEDATAELTSRTFYNCLKNLKKFKYREVPFSAWLYRIASNEVNQYFRKQKQLQRSVSLQDHHIDQLFEEMETGIEQADKEAKITLLLEQLTSEEVQFLELRFFENRSFREVGFILGLSEVNAKVKTYRLLKKMKKIALQLFEAH